MESIALTDINGIRHVYEPDDILWFFEETRPGLVRIINTERQLATFALDSRQTAVLKKELKASGSPIWFGAFQGERLPLNKLPNTRGLGGLSAGSSAVIGHHELIRSGALHDATPHDVEYLTGTMGLKTIIDLRTDLEIAAKPDPAIPGVQWVHVPLLDTWEYEEIGLRTLTESGLEEMRNQGPEMMVRLYRKIVGAPEGIRGLKKFFQILLAQRSGSVLWHCTQGKDRTGVAAAILERILGCDVQVVEQDYLQTNPCLHMQEDQTEAWLTKKLHLSQKTARDFSFLFEARPEFLQAAWDMIDTEFGGFAAYLENQLGLDQEKQAQLKRMYTC